MGHFGGGTVDVLERDGVNMAAVLDYISITSPWNAPSLSDLGQLFLRGDP